MRRTVAVGDRSYTVALKVIQGRCSSRDGVRAVTDRD